MKSYTPYDSKENNKKKKDKKAITLYMSYSSKAKQKL